MANDGGPATVERSVLRPGSSVRRSSDWGPCAPLLGVAVHFEPGTEGRVAAGMKALASLGLHHVRLEVSWADWYDAGVQPWYEWLFATWSRQFTILPALVYLPPASETAGALSIPPERPTAFADFLDALADRFPEAFEWIELPSQPARPGLWDWRLDPRGRVFSQILASAANRCRQRGVKTVFGGLRGDDLGWLALMCENGVLDFADALGLEDDPMAPRASPDRWPTALDAMKRILGEHCRNTPLWITGAGCATDDYEEFAQCEVLMSLLDTEVQRIYWSRLQDAPPVLEGSGSRPGKAGRRLGLLNPDGTPKLLFRLWHAQGIEGVRQCVGWTSAHAEGAEVIPQEQQGPKPILPSSSRSPSEARRPVLITGGAGFIGANLAERLLHAGRPVIVLDNLSHAGVEHNVRYLCDTYGDLVQVYIGDVRSQELLETLVARCDSIFHLAAQVGETTSLADPVEDFTTNLQGTLNVLEAARRQDPPPAVLFTSTSRVYGDLHDLELIPVGKRHVPRDHGIRTSGIGESRPLEFQSPYGCSKGAADQYVLDYARMYGLPGVVFRVSCVYGPRQLGTEDQGWVAQLILQMLRDGPLTIHGDGRQVRDLLYIDDLLDALLAAMKRIETVAGRPFNIGGGPHNAVSLLEVIGRLAELSGIEPQIRYVPRRKGEPAYYVSDVRSFSQATGWAPQITAPRGLPRLYHWILENVQPGVLNRSDGPERRGEIPLRSQ